MLPQFTEMRRSWWIYLPMIGRFFYMAVRTYPLSYMLLFLLMAAATTILLKRFDIWRPAAKHFSS